MHRSSLRLLLVALLALTAASLLGAPAATAAPVTAQAGFGIQAATGGTPDARAGLTYSATPGARVTDQIAVVNIGRKPLTLTVYATDASSGQDGSFALLPRAQKPTQLGTWLALGGRRTVHVPARTGRGPSFVIVPFSLAVPADASPGDHAGGIVVSLAGTAVNKQGVRVKLDQRVALRVYTRVSGALHPGLAVEDLRLAYRGPALIGNPFGGGTATLRYRIHNTGNVLLGATQTASVSSSLGGTVHVKGLPVVPPLLPGASVTVNRRITGVFPGLHVTATVRLRPVAPPGGADPKLGDVSASATLWAVPWSLVLLVLLLLGGAVFFFIRHRRGSLLVRPGDMR